MLYLLRHGETEWNLLRRRQGQGDSPLTALGRKQAEACGVLLRREIANLSRTVLVTSPLGRARATADIIRSCLELPHECMTIENRLIEHHYGDWQGLDDGQIDLRHPGVRVARERDKWNYVVPGGESYALLHQRLLPWAKAHREASTIIAVAHDMVSRVLRGIYLALEPAQVLSLDHPHARIYRLSNGRVAALDAMTQLI